MGLTDKTREADREPFPPFGWLSWLPTPSTLGSLTPAGVAGEVGRRTVTVADCQWLGGQAGLGRSWQSGAGCANSLGVMGNASKEGRGAAELSRFPK